MTGNLDAKPRRDFNREERPAAWTPLATCEKSPVKRALGSATRGHRPLDRCLGAGMEKEKMD